MKRRNLLISLLGGIILMSTINGCTNNTNHIAQSNQTSTSSSGASRSPEEAALEGSFQPLFDFLAEEKKNFSNVKRYYSALSVAEVSELEDSERYTLILKRGGDTFLGTYTVVIEGQETVYPVTVDGENTIQFTNQAPEEGLNPFLFPTISQKEVKELSIFDYTANHPETELKDISYNLPMTNPLVESLIKRYGAKPTGEDLLTATWRGERNYRVHYGVSDDDNTYTIVTGVEFE